MRPAPPRRLFAENFVHSARIHFLCMALAALALLPKAAFALNLDLPMVLWLLPLPLTEALTYTGVAIHECGHALAHWMFGEPALPMFDIIGGGGVTYHAERSPALIAGIYALIAAGAALLLRRKKYKMAGALAAAAALHAFVLIRSLDFFVILVAGHAAEIVAGCVFLVLATLRPHALKTGAERGIALVTGYYFLARNLGLSLGLIWIPSMRLEYTAQKGRAGDLDRAAAAIDVTMPEFAGGMAAFVLSCILLGAVYILWRNAPRR